MHEQGIHFTAYSPLGRPDNMDALTKYDIPVILEAPEVVKIAQELKKEPAQVSTEPSYLIHMAVKLYITHLILKKLSTHDEYYHSSPR